MADENQEKRKFSTWIRILVAGIVLGLAVVVLVWLRQEEPEGYSGEMRSEVILGVETSLLTTPVWVAENKGYFQEEGLNVKIIGFDSGKASLDSMLINQDVDICTVAQTPIVFHSFSRNDFVIIAAMVYSDNDVKVLTRQDRGIVKPSDLRGKKVGITIGSTGQFFLDLFLTHNDVLYSEVEAIDFDPSQLPQALADGRVDAIVTWEPHILNAEELLGEEALILPSVGIYREDFYFVTSKDFVQNNPETLEKFIKAIERGEEFIQENEEESMDIVSERLGLDKEPIVSVWSDFNFQLILDQSIIMCLEDEARWAVRSNLVEEREIPNYLNYVYLDALNEVEPGAVTIIR
jgi:NitT/TauT family transport system substrate-binding protein